MADDDLHLALYTLYELHYRGFEGVADELEWDPGLLAWRRRLETVFLEGLRDAVGPVPPVHPRAISDALQGEIASVAGPSLSGHLCEVGTRRQMEEFAVHRSAYQLKEADPHSWGIPRLVGEAKAALVEIQADEYGNGSLSDMHSELFAVTMRALGLDATYGAYIDVIPGVTLATVNLVSMFGLHRALRGALVGHLAVFEMCSVIPMGRYARALDRLGVAAEARRFYDVHVEADAVHERIADTRLAGGLVEAEPALCRDVVFGARALMQTEARFTSHLLDAWAAHSSSLLDGSRACAA